MARIDNSYLLGLWGLDTSTFVTTPAAVAVRKQPTAPWAASVADKQPTPSEILRKALNGSRFIDEGANKLDLRTKTSSEYRTLFALHTGLQMLESLSDRAKQKGVTAAETARLQQRFDAGLKEVSEYLLKAGAEVDTVRLINGVSATRTQTTTKVARDNHVYTTGMLHDGALSEPVDAFQGDVRFDITIRTSSGEKNIAIDLSEMGATARTMDAVVGHINTRLEAAGVETRFSRHEIPGEARTLNVGSRTITLPSAGDSWALKVTGTSVEQVGFSAGTSGTAVQVVQGTGIPGQYQTLKFDPAQSGVPTGSDSSWVNGRIGQSRLPDGISAVRASAATADGGMWIVADATGDSGGHSVRGQSDVLLMKLDSTGKVVISRGLGAASQAAGYSVTVGADGRVAVAGSVTGALLPGQKVSDASLSDSFVSVFNAEGVEQWTQSRGARAADEAAAVAFGDDGRVYVSGRAKSAMPGATAVGGWDSYVQVFGETEAYPGAKTTPVAFGAHQFGTVGDDSVQALTIDGDNLYTAGMESGAFVVRQFRIGAGGTPELVATRNLGSAHGGEIAGLAVSGGKVVVSGATRNSALDAGTVSRTHAGGTDAFVVSLSEGLAVSGSDRVTYYGSEGEDTAADVKVVNGEVWLTGNWNGTRTASDTDPTTAYLARMDLQTGNVDWSRTWSGDKQQATPATLSVSATGSSVLDRLGLPQGQLVQDVSQKLTEATGLRVGDRFYVTNPLTNRKSAVTIDARDTLQTLATKIETASGRNLKVTVSTDRDGAGTGEGDSRVLQGGAQYLSITNADGRQGALISAGETGKDALAALGLSAGFVGKTEDKRKTVGLDLPQSLNLGNADAAARALDYVQSAMRAVREAYRAMHPTTLASAGKPAMGQPSAYMQSQIANYQAALARLSGG